IYYFTYVSKNPELLTGFLFVANILGIAASYCSKFIVAKLNAKRTVLLGYLIMGICALTAFILYKETFAVMLLMGTLLFSMNMTNACDPELYANCAAYSGKKLGYDVTGTVMGLLAVPIKIGIIMRGILLSACLALAGFDPALDPSAATEELQRGISVGFTVLPASVILVGALILGFGYRLKQED
ncbi:MAG TPA: MFS transporter, partial [Candidatus Blautia stercoravium]|nr:MFS transporter [Candidatus Blautia stercoravium]